MNFLFEMEQTRTKRFTQIDIKYFLDNLEKKMREIRLKLSSIIEHQQLRL